MTAPSVWVAGARPRTLGASVAPVLVGIAASVAPTWPRAIGCIVVALSLQVGVNYANDYFDGVRKVDTPARVGPVRLTASGLASPRAVRTAAGSAFLVAAAVGAWLALATNPWLLLLGAAAIGAAVLYSGGPKPYAARGLGELSVFVFFGLVACVGTAYVQGETIPAAAWWGAVATGLLAVAILVANNLRDIATDATAGKRTLAVRLGDPRTRLLYRGCVATAFALLIAGVAAGALPSWSLLALGSALVAARPFVAVGTAEGRALVPVLVATALLDLTFGVLLAGGLWIGADLTGARLPFAVHLTVPVGDVVERRGWLIEGAAGWGEWSPLPSWSDAERRAAEHAAEEAAVQAFPPNARDTVDVNVMIPRVAPADAARMAVASGCLTAKVKVGDELGPARVDAVRTALGGAARIRLDANGTWPDAEAALSALRAFEAFDIELVEDPVASLEELARVRRSSPIPVAAEMSVRTVGDAARLCELGAADAIVLKPQRIGGVRAALAAAEAAGVPAIASSALETSVGLAAVLALAAALPDAPFAHGIGTATFLASDVTSDPLVPVGGRLVPRRIAPDLLRTTEAPRA